jgi:hypothetical protein
MIIHKITPINSGSCEAAQAIAQGEALRNGIPASNNKGRSPVSERLTPFQGLLEERCSRWSQGFTLRCCLRRFAAFNNEGLLWRGCISNCRLFTDCVKSPAELAPTGRGKLCGTSTHNLHTSDNLK